MDVTNVDGRHGERGGRRKGESTFSEHRVKESIEKCCSLMIGGSMQGIQTDCRRYGVVL